MTCDRYALVLNLLGAPASIGIPIAPVSLLNIYLLDPYCSYLMFAGGSMLGTNSRPIYTSPANATMAPATYFHHLSPMVMQPRKRYTGLC